MGLHEELAAFSMKLDAAINTALETDVADAGKSFLSEAVQTEVYDVFEPQDYKRRGDRNFGLADRETMLTTLDPTTHTLEIEDMSVDEDSGRRVAPVVESGEGYEWNGTKIAGRPRPFHSVAESNFAQSGALEDTLQSALILRGFEVSRL